MCHLVLLLPIFALPVFWLLPLPLAIPLYLLALVVTGLAWWFITRTLHRPVVTGAQGLIGAAGEVVALNTGPGRGCLVRACGELWSARCDTQVNPGDRVLVRNVDGIRLNVVPSGSGMPVAGKSRHCC